MSGKHNRGTRQQMDDPWPFTTANNDQPVELELRLPNITSLC